MGGRVRERVVVAMIAATMAAALVSGPPVAAAGATAVTVFGYGSVWRYDDSGSDLGTAWRTPTYTDTSWPQGPGQLGFGEGDEATVLSPGPANHRILTAYFRRTFTITDPTHVTAITIDLIRDDGAVVYLNGTEVGRSNMPNGTITAGTWASTNLSGTAESTPVTLTAAPTTLLAGTNTIAVEIHQNYRASDDLSFDARLTTTTDTTPTTTSTTTTTPTTTSTTSTTSTSPTTTTTATTVPSGGGGGPVTVFGYGSVWRYDDSGSDLGTAWRTPTYNDTSWPQGPGQLGFGEGDEATVLSPGPANHRILTAYFRRTFTITDPSHVTAITIDLIRDDGAVVYLNGTEVGRSNMPNGTITAGTWASTNLSGTAESTPVTLTAAPTTLLAGTNTIAVEIHQNYRASDDLSFDARLTTTTDTTPTTTSTTTTTPTTTSTTSTTSTTATPTTTSTTSTTTTIPAGGTFPILAAGDIGNSGGHQASVGNLLRTLPGPFLALGDNAYPNGTAADYAAQYDPYFGSEKSRTFPVPGNHEYNLGNANGYLGYFGSRARPNGTTWYSFDVGNWHLVALDSNCGYVGGCGTSSAEYRWLASDLAAHRNPCLLAYWHHAPWSSTPGYTGPTTMVPIMQLLQQHGADVVLAGHLHSYERFARKTATGQLSSSGFRTFVVGTGGDGQFSLGAAAPGSQVRHTGSWGLLRLDLGSTGYTWHFLTSAGTSFTDSGSDSC